jgi:chemotaxis protein CheD
VHVVVGIGEFAVASRPDDVIVTHALGSCIAVCVWDPKTRVSGLLHFLLPDSKINPDRAQGQPATFADTGIPLFLSVFAQRDGAVKRSTVTLIGGARIGAPGGCGPDVGRRNTIAARDVLWRSGALINKEIVGGTAPRTVSLAAPDGRLRISSGAQVVTEI